MSRSCRTENEGFEIRTVHPGTEEERAFLALPGTIYRHNRNYVPWFRRQMKRILAGNHPYFEHSNGEFVVVVRRTAPAQGTAPAGTRRSSLQPVARAALLDPMRHNEHTGSRDARFYFFEALDDPAAVAVLFDYARAWAADRGADTLVGPQGFSAFSGAGILVEGFEHRAAMTMMPYHPPYYQDLLETYGFHKYKDFLSARVDALSQELPERFRRMATIARNRGGFDVPDLHSTADLRALADEIGELYNSAFLVHEHVTPLTNRELAALVDDLLVAADPRLVKTLRRDGRLVGFVLGFPDISDALIANGGRLGPLAMARLLLRKRTARDFIINGLGIDPSYQKSGAIAILFAEIADALRRRHVRTAEMTQIAETTDLMLSNVERLNADVYKRHRVYRIDVSTSSSEIQEDSAR